MNTYRLSLPEYADMLSGEEARIYGGRWNEKGTAVLYTSESAALCMMESLATFDYSCFPENLLLLKLFVPDDLPIKEVSVDELPPGWRTYPHPPTLSRIGTEWAASGTTAVLKVPSVVVPYGEGWNYILNPLNADFRRIGLIEKIHCNFDQRLITHE
jgi:RES domain-containing protein